MNDASPLLLLLARTDDPAIRTLQQQEAHRVAHVSIADLTRAGWRYESGHPEQATACAGGRVIPAEQIAAVLCRIDVVMPADLPHVHRDDRAYVAAELNALLHAWLSQFPRPRFNAPTWAGLTGPAWHPLQWAWLAAQSGVPVAATASSWPAGAQPEQESVTATVVGSDVFGTTDLTLIDHARRVARHVHSELLAVTFVREGAWKFQRANPCPAFDDATAAALLARTFACSNAASPTISPDKLLCSTT